MAQVVADEDSTERQGMRRDQQIHRTDWRARQLVSQSSVFVRRANRIVIEQFKRQQDFVNGPLATIGRRIDVYASRAHNGYSSQPERNSGLISASASGAFVARIFGPSQSSRLPSR